MTDILGFVVLARRPNPYKQDPWDYWAVGKSFDTTEAAQAAVDGGALRAEIVAEKLKYNLDRDSAPNHRHHRECIHNLTSEQQITLRGRTVGWWINARAEWPKQINPGHWETEPKPDPVEYVVVKLVPVRQRETG